MIYQGTENEDLLSSANVGNSVFGSNYRELSEKAIKIRHAA